MNDKLANSKAARVRQVICGAAALVLPLPVLAQPAAPVVDPIRVLVKRLDLERYKATIKGLTQFGDRRQGTARNRAAVDWIEAQLKSYGCTNTERLTYTFGEEPAHRVAPAKAGGRRGVGRARPLGRRRRARAASRARPA